MWFRRGKGLDARIYHISASGMGAHCQVVKRTKVEFHLFLPPGHAGQTLVAWQTTLATTTDFLSCLRRARKMTSSSSPNFQRLWAEMPKSGQWDPAQTLALQAYCIQLNGSKIDVCTGHYRAVHAFLAIEGDTVPSRNTVYTRSLVL